MSEKEIEAKLRRLGARRKRHQEEGKAIREAVTEAVAEARGVVPMQRAADLLDVHRGSLYDQFINGGSNGDDQAREGAAA